MRAEAEWLLALARGAPEPPGRRVGGGPDWGRLCDLAARHQVDALCAWTWRSAFGQRARERWAIPERELARLRASYLHHRLRNESLERDLEAIATALARRRVEALFLKGPWLAFRAYPDPGARPIGDVDLCVRESDYAGAVAALANAGYLPVEPLPASSEAALKRAHYSRQLRFSARARRPVELHFRLINLGPPGPPEGWIWDTARNLSCGGCRVRVPGPEAMILHLLLHANQHAFALLRLLYDIRFAFERDAASFDVGLLLEQAKGLRCRASLYHALTLARELAGAPVGDALPRMLRPSRPRRSLYSALWRLSAARRLEVELRHSQLETPLLYLLEMGRPRDKARYLLGVVREAGGLGAFARRAHRARVAPSRRWSSS